MTRPRRGPDGVARSTTSLLIVLVAAISLVASLPSSSAAATVPFRVGAYEWADVCPDGLPWTDVEAPPLRGFKPRDRFDVPMYRVQGQLYYRPGAIAINGMKRVDAYRDSGDERQLEQAQEQAKRLRWLAMDRRNASWLPFWFDYRPAAQRAPWVNAMTQGLVLSFFVRLYHVTGDDVYLEEADAVFRSFLRLRRGRVPWVAYVDGQGFLWLEHYPHSQPDHVLNAHLHAIFGIYEYWQATRSPAARRLMNGAVTTVRRNVQRYRHPGEVSAYGLRSRSAIPKYHEIHVWQLNLLSRISGDTYFAAMADRFVEDRRPVGHVNGRPARHGPGIVGPQCRPEVVGQVPVPAEPREGAEPTV